MSIGMSTTTTSTTTYKLVAYRYQQDKPGVIRPNVPKDEWRIYPSSVPSSLCLTLETTRTSSGVYVSLVMKIVDTDETRPGGPSTLERLDFLDFSGPEVAKIPSSLKAVLGGKQVGFRYLHPLNADASAQYHKRFQLTFMSGEDATTLVASIRHVCPTTESPQAGTTKTAQRAKALPKPTTTTQSYQTQEDTSIDKDSFSRGSQVSRAQNVAPQVDAIMSDNHPTVPASHTTHHPTTLPSDAGMDVDIHVVPIQAPPFHLPISSPMPLTPNAHCSQTPQMRQFTSNRPPIRESAASPVNTVPIILPSSGTLHNASQGPAWPRQTSTPDSSIGAIPPFSQIPPSGDPITQLDIQNLSSHELEAMVAQVVHEPGFAELMERLDQMYALKGFIKY